MSRRYRLAGLISLSVAALALTAGAALGYIGTRGGKKLAAELLRSYNHTHYLAGSIHGSVYYCPSDTSNAIGGYDVELGGRPPKPCANHPAKATWVETLSHGEGVSVVGKVTAKHRPTITFASNKSATFFKARGAHCWTKQVYDYNFIKTPPFGFFPKEYMTVGAKHGSQIQLLGRMKDFHEVDTLNRTTHQMIGESIFFSKDHLISSYHTTHTKPAFPRTRPVC